MVKCVQSNVLLGLCLFLRVPVCVCMCVCMLILQLCHINVYVRRHVTTPSSCTHSLLLAVAIR